MKAAHGPKIIAIGQLPPPVNGLTFVTSRMLSVLRGAGYEVAFVDTAGGVRNRSPIFHLSRLAKTLRAMLSIAWSGISGSSRTCYFTADGGLGLIYSVMIAGCARLFRLRIYVHHHSFSYIVQRRALMKLLLAWSGKNAIHICLCDRMAQDLATRYGRQIRSLILSNAAFADAETSAMAVQNRETVAIGLLSNLTSDKGLYEFLEIVRTAKQRGLPIRGILAGPVKKEKDRIFLDAVREEVGDYLDYRGAIYAEEKSRFFGDIDVFVFLTSYLNEAQPMVLYEAIAHGIPVISYDRGCIRCQVADAGLVFAAGTDVVAATLKALEGYRDSPENLIKLKRAALRNFQHQQLDSRTMLTGLFDARPESVDENSDKISLQQKRSGSN